MATRDYTRRSFGVLGARASAEWGPECRVPVWRPGSLTLHVLKLQPSAEDCTTERAPITVLSHYGLEKYMSAFSTIRGCALFCQGSDVR